MLSPESIQDITVFASLGLSLGSSWLFGEYFREIVNPDNVLVVDMVRNLIEIGAGIGLLVLLGDISIEQGGINGAVVVGVVAGMFTGLQVHGGIDTFRSIVRADKLI